MYEPFDDQRPRTAKHGLVEALTGGQNSGYAGGMPGAAPVAPSEPAAAPVAAPAPFQRKDVRLMEGDAGKLANTAHAAKSPKYDFLQLANSGKYGYDQLGDMLGELQKGPNAAHWQGWTADNDKFRFKGDPSQLGRAWNGVTEVDAIGGFNSGNPQGFRWGAEDPNAAAAPQGRTNAGRPSFAGSTINQLLQGDAQQNVQQALAQFGGTQDNSMIQRLIAQLQGGQS